MLDQELGSIEAVASMDNWDSLNDFVNELISISVRDKSQSYKLRLASEELISNIIRAATEAPHSESAEVVLQITVRTHQDGDENWFILRTKDNGIHFDPQFEQRIAVDTEQDVSARAIGGLGLFLIQQSCPKVTYEWDGQFNIYELWVTVNNGEQTQD